MQFLLFLVLFVGLHFCNGSNILIISTVASHSHSIWCNKLAELLLNAGHKVTIIDTDPPRKSLTNLRTYTLEGAYAWAGHIDYTTISAEGSPKDATDFLMLYNNMSCVTMLHSPTFGKFLSEHPPGKKPYDLVIHDICNCECFLGLVPRLGNPKLILATAFFSANLQYMMKSPINVLKSPMWLSHYSHPMDFRATIDNLFYTLYHYYHYDSYAEEMDRFSKKMFGDSTPHVLDIARSSAIALVNTHPLIDGAKYYSPSVVPISGFHIDETKNLDKDIKEFLDGAEHGAIYFSLGSNIESSLMPEEKIQMFIKVFEKLKQRVLWKFENSKNTKWPENVKVSKWMKQNDVLAHPNVKVFITHCGLLGTQEAIHYGVPMIGMPFYIDQHFNAKRLLQKGVLVPLSFPDLTEQKLQNAIQEILTQESYGREMKRLSKLFKDRPMKPKDLALFWIEYVLRNEGMQHLQAPEFALEMLLFSPLTVILLFSFTVYILYILYKLCSSDKSRRKYKKH